MLASTKIRPALALASVGAATFLFTAVSAQAAGAKPISVTLPASVFKDDTSRVCMPRTVLGREVDKTLPETICETRSQWSARGVTIITK
jgi:hypothetical protein